MSWNCLFVLPEWLKVWWAEFGKDGTLDILSVGNQKDVIGLAPLQVKESSVSFIGGTNVCDYLDFTVAAGKEEIFFDTLLDYLARKDIKNLDLGLLRPDSTVLSSFVNVAESRGCQVATKTEDISLELALPSTWEEYLAALKGKQRHEVKRKFRRLHEAGDIVFRTVDRPEEIADQMPVFFDLFEKSGYEKAAFMDGRMLSFFGKLSIAMAAAKMLKLYILELDARPVAVSFCFDFNNTLHLYNSGFDPSFGSLSVGLLCKVLSLKDAIERGRNKYDFLKGAETYKYRLGGKEVPLVRCRVEL
jgi:CelD/BcsL family acetyltransferase involved in cellulose biosynthesis